MWEASNKAQQRWDLERGITQRKEVARKQEWKQAPTGKAWGSLRRCQRT